MCSAGQGASDPGVRAVVRDWRDANEVMARLNAISEQAVVVWQYVPHMYGRGGVTRALPRVMAKLCRKGRRQVLLAHEIAADLSVHPARLWYALNHRWQWRRLVESADAVAISCSPWVEQWKERMPTLASKFFALPSPSNVEPRAVHADHRAAWRRSQGLPELGRILTYFGSLNPTKRFDWVVEAWERADEVLGDVALVAIGDLPNVVPNPRRAARFKGLGRLDPGSLSAAMHATDVLALPFLDGASERRSTLMCGLAHSLAVCSTVGHNTSEALVRAKYLALTPAMDRERFVSSVSRLLADGAERARLGVEAGRAYRSNFSWPVIGQMLAGRIRPWINGS